MKPHFHLFGIPVRIELFFFLLVGFLGWSSQRPAFLLAAWVVIVFISILWHEMGHAFAFRAFGYAPAIVLHGFGGATSSLSPVRLTPRRDIAISLAGPAAGMALGGAIFALSRLLDLDGPPTDLNGVRLRVIVSDLLFVNIGWGIFNLLPMLPLDGGRIMAASLDLVTKGKGETSALIISLIVGMAIAVLAFFTENTWAALLVLFLGLNNFTALQQKRKLAPQAEDLQRLQEGYEALDRRDLATASQRAAAVLSDPKSPEVQASATNLLMWTQMQQGRFKEAAQLGEQAFAERPDPYLAYHVSRAWARAGWRKESLDWFAKAVDNGFSNVEELDAEPDFASVRGSGEFDRLRDRMLGRTASESQTAGTGAGPPSEQHGEHVESKAPVHEKGPEAGSIVKAILLINVVVFLLQTLRPGLTSAFGQSPEAIARGEWYRLLTPMLLHAGFIHIAFNSYALWIYGPAVERVFGSARLLGLYVIAGFTGAVASYAFGKCPSLGVGASGAIFGIIGVLLVFSFNRRKVSRAGAANLQAILVIIGLNLLIGFTVPRIDNFAHMGGLAGGIVVGAAFDLMQTLRAMGRIPLALAVSAELAVAMVVILGAAALAIYRTLTFAC